MDTQAKIDDLITTVCRSNSERTLIRTLAGEIFALRQRVDKLEELGKKPKEPTVTKPPAKAPKGASK